MRVFGKGFNFSQDGPGNRLVYHLSGCNMRCIWCSNPDGMEMTAGSEYTIDDLVAEAVSCRPMFFSGGGVTFTGGEATLQYAELREALHRLQDAGIHTALETNATHEKLPELAEYIDYLIMDFKHDDSGVLREYTGVGNETVKRNFERFCADGRQLHVRIPLINEINADRPDSFAQYFAAHDTANVVFEFLAYHEYGKAKWKTPYQVQNGFVTPDQLRAFRDTFTQYGLHIVNT